MGRGETSAINVDFGIARPTCCHMRGRDDKARGQIYARARVFPVSNICGNSPQDMGARVRAYDPVGMEQAKDSLPKVAFCNGPYERWLPRLVATTSENRVDRRVDFDASRPNRNSY